VCWVALPNILAAPPPGFKAPEKPKEGDYSESNFDEFSGFSENLFGTGTFDKEDDEADAIYLAIDNRMDRLVCNPLSFQTTLMCL